MDLVPTPMCVPFRMSLLAWEFKIALMCSSPVKTPMRTSLRISQRNGADLVLCDGQQICAIRRVM
eukprot:5964682-Amphidinium_carterae.1